jgi:hypothetical protein
MVFFTFVYRCALAVAAILEKQRRQLFFDAFSLGISSTCSSFTIFSPSLDERLTAG